MTDDGYQTLEVYQLARSLAISIHTITLSPSDRPQEVTSALRRTSRTVAKSIVDAYDRRTVQSGFIQILRESKKICLSILEQLSSPQISASLPEKVRRDFSSEYRRLSGLVEKITESRPPGQIFPYHSIPVDRQPRMLEGKLILITRSFEQSRALVQAVEHAGGLPVVIPMIEIIEPDSWEPVDRSIADLAEYDGVIFTSQNAVERFVGRVQFINPAARNTLATRRIYPVGERTGAALEKAGFPVTLVPEHFSARDLILSLQKEPLGGRRFLFPKADIAKEDIPAALRGQGAQIDEIVVYRTVGPNSSNFEPLRYALKNGEIDVVTFFSPSSVRNFAQYLEVGSLARTVAACIGPSTAREAEISGLPSVVTAKDATIESMIEVLTEHFQK